MLESQDTITPQVRFFDGYDWPLTKTYRRNLPHWELVGSTYFITFRVNCDMGSPFKDSCIANLMTSCLYKEHKKSYLLEAYVIMPDHVHLIIKPFPGYTLAKILRNLKGFSAFEANKLLNRSGKFWQSESFDHLIRNNASLREKWEYIKNNPVKAKIVVKAEDYPFSSFYVDPAKITD